MTTFKELLPEKAGQAARPGTQGKLTLAQILEILAGGRLPLRFTAYDGSAAGPPDAPLGDRKSVV